MNLGIDPQTMSVKDKRLTTDDLRLILNISG